MIPKITFLNQPYLEDRSKVSAMVSFVGIGLNSSYEEDGIQYGPDAIRKVSLRYSNGDGSSQPIKIYNPDRGYILEGVTIEDTGNIELTQVSPEKMIEDEIRKILKARSFPLVVGGDHFVTLPIVSAYEEPVTVVQLDAHGDYLPVNCGYPHGSVMRNVADLRHVKRIIHCGLRGNLNTGPGLDDSVKRGNVIITSKDLIHGGADRLLRELDYGEPVYTTFDGDFLDPSIAPAVGVPEPDGIGYSLARELLCGLGEKADVKGIDFTEYNPRLDLNYITGVHITNLIFEFLSGRFRKR